jgi:hypothetical protein
MTEQARINVEADEGILWSSSLEIEPSLFCRYATDDIVAGGCFDIIK